MSESSAYSFERMARNEISNPRLALDVCRSAIAGEAEVDAARASFEAFARARCIEVIADPKQ